MADGDYEKGARVGLGIKMAHEAALHYAADGQQYSETLGALMEPIIELVIETQAKYLALGAFPGATAQPQTAGSAVAPPQAAQAYPSGAPVVQQPQQQVQAPQPQQAQPVQPFPQQTSPAPIPNQGNDQDAEKARLWQLFFSDPTAWNDQRHAKTGNQPDFKHRSQKDGGGKYYLSLWITGAPDWATQQLRQMGLVA